MENKEEIKRIDGKYYLVRELEMEGDPVRIDGEKLQPMKSIDDDDCQHCCLYDKSNCGEPCSGGFFVRVLPENSKEKDAEKLSNMEETGENLEPEKEETTMELKIGQIFQHNKKWYQCVEGGDDCKNCAFYDKEYSCCDTLSPDYYCCDRSDGKDVIFKELERVGEIYPRYAPTGRVIYFQSYKCYRKPVYNGDFIYWSDDITISIEIKQTKEDMEEKMKPFDLEAAKSGKPVCTRNGRKARIICFDLKNGNYPIVAAIGNDCSEALFNYTIKGEIIPGVKSEKDLMMLPEKKEGWVNVYEGGLLDVKSYKTKEEALAKASHKNYVDTVKIEWEE